MPKPPANGLILRGYCSYLQKDIKGRIRKATRYYYEENPDRWIAETQSDTFWLKEEEWRTLIPKKPVIGDRVNVSKAIQQRFYGTVGIDYMEGSVNSLPARETTMTLKVTRASSDSIYLQLNGYAKMGKALNLADRNAPRTRGCELRIKGRVHYSKKQDRITFFTVAGLGNAWGNKMEYTNREIRIKGYPWMYGIACELVSGDNPIDQIPPYNLLHYSDFPYFGKK